MLKSWLIQNFKPILNSGELQLAPVTVLAGRNSSGKSSLIQSILMISQTLSSRVLDRALLPNGPTIQLGTFEDILSEQTKLRSLVVGFELEIRQKEQKPPARNATAKSIGQRIIRSETEIRSVKTYLHFLSASDNGTSSSAIEAAKVNVDSVSLNVTIATYNENLPYQSDQISEEDIDSQLEYNLTIHRLSPPELEEFLTRVAPVYLRLIPYPTDEANYLGVFTSNNKTANTKPPTSSLISFSHFLPTSFIRKYSIGDRYKEALTEYIYSITGTR